MGDLEWTNDLVIRFIQEYRSRPELWDNSHELYRVQTMKYESWRDLAGMFECDIADLRKKLNSLFASHRREKAKVRGGARSTWFLYPYLSFLPNHVDDSASEPQYITIQTQSTRKSKVKEPESSSEDEHEEEIEVFEEDVDMVPEEIVVKEEPEVQYVKPKPRLRQTNTHRPRLSRPMKRSLNPVVKESSSVLIHRLAEALKLLKKSEQSRRKDSCDSFGEYIADSLRKHDERTQSMIKQAINNILFEQEMKKYNSNNQYSVVISGVEQNPLTLEDSEK